MRILICPVAANPLAFAYWLENLKTYLHLFDKVVVVVNGLYPREWERIYVNLLPEEDRKISLAFNHGIMQHGSALEIGVGFSLDDNDVIMFTDDDCFVKEPEGMAEVLRSIESDQYDITGVHSNGYSQRILDKHEELHGNRLPGLWPILFCSKRKWLKNRNLGGQGWDPGTIIDALGCSFDVHQAADTLQEASMNMIAEGASVNFFLDPKIHECTLNEHGTEWPRWAFHTGSSGQVMNVCIVNPDTFVPMGHDPASPAHDPRGGHNWDLLMKDQITKHLALWDTWVKTVGHLLPDDFMDQFTAGAGFYRDHLSPDEKQIEAFKAAITAAVKL